MSEGKRTPGPFCVMADTIARRLPDDGYIGHLTFVDTPRLNDSERAELADLLNKGTHFDGMLAALKAQRDAEGILTRSDREQALARAWEMADTAIAECEEDAS